MCLVRVKRADVAALTSAVIFYLLLILLLGFGAFVGLYMFSMASWGWSLGGPSFGDLVLVVVGLVLLLMPVLAIRHQIRWMRSRRQPGRGDHAAGVPDGHSAR